MRSTRLVTVALVVVKAALAQTTLNLSEDLVRLGIASSNMVPNQPTLDSGPLMQSGVSYATNHSIANVIADPGAYYFLSIGPGNRHLNLGGTGAMMIDLQGSDLYFAYLSANAFGLYAGANTVVQNFTIDYLQLPYTQLMVTAVNTAQRQVQFTIQPGWQKPSALNALLSASGTSETDVYIFRNGQPWAGYTRMPAQQPFADDVLTIPSKSAFTATISDSVFASIRPGDIAVPVVRTGGWGVLADGPSGCVGCTFRNIKIYSGGGGFSLSGQSSLLEHVEVIPRPGTDRLVSTMFDGITMTHWGASAANNTIRLCRSIRTLDDGFSPHEFVYGSVQVALNSRSFQIQGDAGTQLNSATLPNGSNVAFQSPTDGTVLAIAVVVSQATAAPVGGLNQIVLNFDRDLPSSLVGSYVYSTDPSGRGGGLLLDRNAMGPGGWARGMSIWGLMNTSLVGNYIHDSLLAGVDLQHQLSTGDWLTPPLIGVTLTNNVIDGANLDRISGNGLVLGGIEVLAQQAGGSPMVASPDQNITITNNFIANPGRSAVWVGNTTGGSVSGNYFLNPNNTQGYQNTWGPVASLENQNLPVVVESSVNVTNTNNTVDSTSGRAFVTDTQFRELAAYAPGSTIRLNAYNLGQLATPSVVLTDSNGNQTPMTIQNTTTHALNVLIPATAGLGGAYVTITSGSAKYFATLFLDSVDNIPALNGCTYELSPSATSTVSGSTSVSVLVVTQSGCSYQVLDTDPFVSAGAPASGTGIMTVSLAANTGAARTTTFEIAGQPITLTQAAAPSFTVSGQVTVSGIGLSGVTINVNGSQTASATTGASGNFSLALFGNGAYTLSAASLGYSFSAPVTLSNLSSNQTANFTGIGLAGLQFYKVTPCRIADTRAGAGFSGPYGPPAMTAGSTRTFNIPASSCGIPSTATAYSLNFTVIPPGPLGNLTTWPTGQSIPNVSTLNDSLGTVVANAAIVPAGTNGAINVYVTDTTNLLFDINGYFAPPATSGLEFYPATPCRIADTRTGAGFTAAFGPPSIAAGATRAFSVPSSPCGIPSTASAYSLNFTAIPPGPLGNLTTWPTGQSIPNVSTLNDSLGTIVANAAIVPAGTSGAINVFVTQTSDVLFDVNGYFAPPLSSGLQFYPVTPCRIADTRAGAGFPSPFGPPSITAGSTRTFNIPASSCGIPATVSAYSLNFTVIPPGPLGNLTTWPAGQSIPNVSTLNDSLGTIVANAAIVPAGTGGAINVFVTQTTDVLFDINGYFATGTVLADSTNDFSSTQGAKNWYYGYFPGGNVNAFTQLPTFSTSSFWWQHTTFNPPLTWVGSGSLARPNGANSGGEEWAVREWVSSYAAAAIVNGQLRKDDTNPASTGVYGRIYLNHQLVYEQFVAGTDGVGVSYSLPLTLRAGDTLDFAVAPNGVDLNDRTYFSSTISH